MQTLDTCDMGPNPENLRHQDEPNVNCGLWVIVICQRRFIIYNKCTIWGGGVDIDNGGGYACVGAGRIWGNVHLPLNSVNLKLLKKWFKRHIELKTHT